MMSRTAAAAAPMAAATTQRAFGTITPNVSFDTLAREWRFKWSAENDKASLSQSQDLLTATLGDIKKIEGVTEVQRIVCGGCQDFKVITSFNAAAFEPGMEALTPLEEAFLAAAAKIDGVSQVETQTYTIEKM